MYYVQYQCAYNTNKLFEVGKKFDVVRVVKYF